MQNFPNLVANKKSNKTPPVKVKHCSFKRLKKKQTSDQCEKINLKRKQLSKLHFYVERSQLTHTNKQTKQMIESLTDVTREGSKKKAKRNYINKFAILTSKREQTSP